MPTKKNNPKYFFDKVYDAITNLFISIIDKIKGFIDNIKINFSNKKDLINKLNDKGSIIDELGAALNHEELKNNSLDAILKNEKSENAELISEILAGKEEIENDIPILKKALDDKDIEITALKEDLGKITEELYSVIVKLDPVSGKKPSIIGKNVSAISKGIKNAIHKVRGLTTNSNTEDKNDSAKQSYDSIRKSNPLDGARVLFSRIKNKLKPQQQLSRSVGENSAALNHEELEKNLLDAILKNNSLDAILKNEKSKNAELISEILAEKEEILAEKEEIKNDIPILTKALDAKDIEITALKKDLDKRTEELHSAIVELDPVSGKKPSIIGKNVSAISKGIKNAIHKARGLTTNSNTEDKNDSAKQSYDSIRKSNPLDGARVLFSRIKNKLKPQPKDENTRGNLEKSDLSLHLIDRCDKQLSSLEEQEQKHDATVTQSQQQLSRSVGENSAAAVQPNSSLGNLTSAAAVQTNPFFLNDSTSAATVQPNESFLRSQTF